MKAYVITFCVWKSPGSMLQSLGLKRALQSLNCDSTLLQIGTPEEYRLSFPKNIRDAYYFPLRCFRHRQLQSGYQNNTAFIRERAQKVDKRFDKPADGAHIFLYLRFLYDTGKCRRCRRTGNMYNSISQKAAASQ